MMYAVAVLILCSIVCVHAVTTHCHGDRCYWISNTAEGNWTEGRAACQSEGEDLTVMEREELFDFVVSTFRLVILNNETNTKIVFCKVKLISPDFSE